jgi:hypothetical protein
MYNVRYLAQCEESRRHLLGVGGASSSADSAGRLPVPPVVILPCRIDTNGEWIPAKGTETNEG